MECAALRTLERALKLGPLAEVSDKARASLAAHARVQSFAQGDMLFREGDKDADPMLLLSGLVKLFRHTLLGKECVLHLVRPGRLLDPGVVFYEDFLPVSAVAVQESSVLRLKKAAVLDSLQSESSLGVTLLRALCHRQRLFINKIASSQGRISIVARVAAWLLHRAKMEKSATLHLRVTQEILARQMGISRESLNRELSALVAAGLIERTRRTITLLDPDALRSRASS